MLRLSYCLFLCTIFSMALSQSVCNEEVSNCPDGQFCHISGYCVPCVKCKDFNREEKDVCVMTLDMCGPCMSGFEESEFGGSLKCVMSSSSPNNLLIYIIVASVLVILVLVVVTFYCTRTRYFKREEASIAGQLPIYTTPRDHVCTPIPRTPPAPYNNNYVPLSPTSPPLEFTVYRNISPDPSRKLKERNDSIHLRQQRENDFNQEATVFLQPNYIDNDEQPPSYDEALSEDSNETIQDETTRESLWSPTTTACNDNTNLSAMLAEAQNKVLVRPPTPPSNKVLYVVDENNRVRVRIPVTNSDGASSTNTLSHRIAERRPMATSDNTNDVNSDDSQPELQSTMNNNSSAGLATESQNAS